MRSSDVHERRLRVRVSAVMRARRVELFGELGDWINPRPMQIVQATAGELFAEATLRLLPGVYAYKLRVDGQWALDEGNPRTRAAGEHRNNVLSVGGAPEPILFAPAAPFVRALEGGIEVIAALRRGHGAGLVLCWSEPDASATQRAPMQLAAEEGEHLLFRARIPTDAAQLRFELESGALVGPEDQPGDPFLVDGSHVNDLPAWWRDAVVYTVFVDRFRPAHDALPWGVDPGPDRPAGGHLEGVTRSLDELRDLGVNTLYLTPIHVAASCHRYDLVDPRRVDPALGGEAAFERLLAAAHARGMRVLLDLCSSHAGRGFPPYDDVIARGRASRWAAWFRWTSPEEGEPALMHYGRRTDAPLLDLENAEVRALVLATAESWARRGVDGLRLDAAAEVPIDLARDLRRVLRAARGPDALVLGELVPAHAWRWRAEHAVDAATDFGFHTLALDFIARRAIDAGEVARRLIALELDRGAPPHASLRFVSTHDHPRFATIARLAGAPGRALLGLFFLLTSPGVPALLYGEELGMAAELPRFEPEDVWPDRAPMPWGTQRRAADATRAAVKRLLAARRASAALARGAIAILFAEGSVLVYRREAEGEVVDVVINAGPPIEIELDDEARPGVDLIATVGEVGLRGGVIVLGEDAGAALRRR